MVQRLNTGFSWWSTFQCRHAGSISGQGTKIPQATGQLSPHTATWESHLPQLLSLRTCSRAHVPYLEKPAHQDKRSPCMLQWSTLSAKWKNKERKEKERKHHVLSNELNSHKLLVASLSEGHKSSCCDKTSNYWHKLNHYYPVPGWEE